MGAGDWPSVGDVLRRAASLWGGRIAAVEGRAEEDYRSLHARARRAGSGLRRLGLFKGSRVAFVGDNSMVYLECYFGFPLQGLVFVPINTRLASEEMVSIVRDCACSAIVAGPGYEELAAEIAAQTGALCLTVEPRWRSTTTYQGLMDEGGEATETVDPDDTAYIYYTSGSTGQPKGVMLSHANVVSGSLTSCVPLGLRGRHTWLHAGPMFHLGDACILWGLTCQGGRHVIERFHPESTLHTAVQQGVTHLSLVPTAVDALAEAAAASGQRWDELELLIYGGAPMPAAMYERVTSALDVPLMQVYGITETSGVCAVLQPEEHVDARTGQQRFDSCGKEAPLMEVELRDEENRAVDIDTPGEVVVTSPAVMNGYWGRPDETARVLHGSTFATGDIGMRDGDGFLRLVDRKKDVIITGGENVYSREVEQVLARHPGVADVAVVAKPDPKWGETVCAVIVAEPGHAPTLEDLRQLGRQHIAGYKLPRYVVTVEALPLTGSGKVNKPELRQLAHGA